MLASAASRLMSAERVLAITAVVVVELCESNLRKGSTYLYSVPCDHVLEVGNNDIVVCDRRMKELSMWLVASFV